ncbi:Transthyretin-like family protein [Caenorhabditis elegans]|uniref:Transthyretin-like family protein n=1 Tax=Caenorhabditis elegans TaxID=6239 RepID=Q22803_CAEEL|nr:Transthyretin-like family protein [Caenorhabditis elegans]CCD73163.1 Transthyretin-like family protein [Caenorhabditis elegans]|eukprot:NP_501433.2 Uncharacterized protein CELE_T26A8.3 [Caenorhabditis elegans]
MADVCIGQMCLSLCFFCFDVFRTDTTFHFNGKLTCGTQGAPFKVNFLSVYERDLIKDDYLGTIQNFEKDGSGFKYAIDVKDNGDGPFNEVYEIFFVIQHDCTPDRQLINQRVSMTGFQVMNGQFYHTLDIDLQKSKRRLV